MKNYKNNKLREPPEAWHSTTTETTETITRTTMETVIHQAKLPEASALRDVRGEGQSLLAKIPRFGIFLVYVAAYLIGVAAPSEASAEGLSEALNSVGDWMSRIRDFLKR